MERIKRRGDDLQLSPGSVFLCPHLFSSSFNTTKSITKLLEVNDDGSGGVFQKTDKLTRNSFLSRSFSDLYFITAGADPLPPSPWIPTFSFRDILKDEPVELTEGFPGQESSLALLEKEGCPAMEDKDQEDQFYVDVSKTCEPPPLPEEAPKRRFGRTLRAPQFYQA